MMPEIPEPDSERRQRLERARTEIDAAIRAGQTLDAADWRSRYPDLQPELDTLFALPSSSVAAESPPQETVATHPPDRALEATMASPSVAVNPRAPVAGDEVTAFVSRFDDARSQDETSGRMERSDLTTEHVGGSGHRPAATANRARRNAAGQADDPLLPTQKVRYIGDYEVVSILGRGGMGVVYKARQVSLNRPVALKMIRSAEFAGEDQIRRFQNEAEAVAMLDHPGIVPVYEVGQFQDQRYFSMKLIEGAGLDKHLTSLAAKPRDAAKLVADVADAIYHAHQRGILHRDLKPANILVDGQGRPHVTDFGLAKRIEGEDGLTVTGAIMGTPAYMAPEQALGRTSQITTATDVYGLGAILYATLTGRAPFAGDSVLETLEQVRQRAPEPPTRRNVRLPRDLEVICLKCLEKDPRHRYPSAGALADDLRCWINGEPISARPVGRAVRAWMWTKRNPAMASLAASLVAALIVGVVGITLQWREAVAQRNLAVKARDDAVTSETAARKAEGEAKHARDASVVSEKAAQTARAQAEQNATIAGMQATLALGTVQSLISQTTEKLQGPGLFDIRKALLEVALLNVNKVADIYDKAPSSKEATTATALVELGRIYRELGQSEKSSRHFLKALEIAKERIKIKKGSDASRRNLAIVYSNLGATAEELNRDMNAALDYHLKALALFEDIDQKPMLADSPMPRPFIRANLAEAHKLVGVMHYRVGKLDAALPYYRKAYNLARELAEAQPNDPALQVNLTKSALALGSTAFRTGDRTQADTFLAEARERAQKLLAARPNDLDAKINLGDVLYLTGETHFFAGKLPEARADMQGCLKLYEEIAKADARNVFYQRNLSKALYRIGDLDLAEKKPDDARSRFDAAQKIRAALVEISKENDRRQMELMLTQAQVGQVDAALATADRLAVGPKVDSELRMDLARCYAIASRTLPEREAERAETLRVKAMEALRAAVKDGYRDRGYLEGEPDFEPLRGREDFKALLAEIPIAKP
jgi:tetratricopeptide (TPR) repeat protein/tRNA A-37 threonylcarbamoyl transferase component Bud32